MRPIEDVSDTSGIHICPHCSRVATMMALIADDGPCELRKDGLHFTLTINCGDTFHYACGDGEDVPDEALQEVFAAWNQHGYLGLVIWIAKQRGMKPLVEVCEDIEDAGLLLPAGLRDNPENNDGHRWHSKRGR